MSRSSNLLIAPLVIGSLVASPAPVRGQQGPAELGAMTLEELMDVQVTTVARSPERAMSVAAAIHVITTEDIQRSGATSLAELLRLAPGMQVARIDAGLWAVGTRGFADRLSRSMLVLIDGRAVFSPLLAGTYWEAHDLVLDDIERIEVIRGPGGTLWGSNAVNGIVSIVTKAARDTQGPLLAAAVGSEDRFQGTARYGAALGDNGFVRGYVTGFDRESQFNTGELEYDSWRMVQSGFRLDSELGELRRFTLQGDAYTSRVGQFMRATSLVAPYLDVRANEVPLRGANVLGRVSGPVGDRFDVQLQTWYDWTDREEYPVSETRETFDADLQLRHHLGTHDLAWGFAYRYSTAEIATAPTATLPSGSETLVSAFLQDEIALASDQLRLTLGVKLEHNRYSGLEVQPSARAVWLVNPSNTWWASVTRAVRRPSRVERLYATTSVLDPATPAFIRLSPNPDFEPERLVAYETGYRVRPSERTYFTVSAFYNEWDELLSTELGQVVQETTPPPPRTIFPVSFQNGIDGTTFGVEVTADVRPVSRWRWIATYSLLRAEMTPEPGSTDITQESRYEDGVPRHQVRMRNSFDLPGGVALDWHLRYVSELPDVDIPAYATSDVRLAWLLTGGLELEAVGRNLHEAHHPEWPGENGGADVEIERSLYVGFTWRH
jgi:iron complex outermembrane recepter protein